MFRSLVLALFLLPLLGCTPIELNEQQRAFIAAGGLRQPPIQPYIAPMPYQMQVPRLYHTNCSTIGQQTYCTTR